jgi:FkbM family methyltransferase
VRNPLVALRRRFLPAHVRADIRDQELLRERMAELIQGDSDCLDVGAHEGVVLGEMLRLAPHGRHTAWEPLPEFAELLRTRHPSAEVRQAALSDREGERDFFLVLDDPGWSGFRERESPAGGGVEEITVRTERLDDVLGPDRRPAFLKIDVEGAEAEVLRGAIATLREHRPAIAFEHGLGSADHYGTTPEEMYDLLTGLDYEIFGLDLDGPYTRERFAEIFATAERVNFLACPTSG